MKNDYRQKLHLEPEKGWLNDPNGLCFFRGEYHVYFQYAPESAEGQGKKCWGHWKSPDLINWTFTGTVLFPDTPDDRSGVYSGCGFVKEDTLYLFYTGNVKEEGNHDYITSGRGANVILVTTKDGHNMSAKKTLLRNSDYPDYCSCHVRDPKVWEENGRYYMVLGARTLAAKGCVLYYVSEDLVNWTYDKTVFGSDGSYMWECPDVFTLGSSRFLSVSPQGLPHEKFVSQNVYSSGYFTLNDGVPDNYREWDCGFDFYAPQTFDAPDGRKILIGWEGIGDIPYSNPTVKQGWQHCLTLPRELSPGENGVILQQPIRELEKLRKPGIRYSDGDKLNAELPFELYGEAEGDFTIELDGIMKLGLTGDTFSLTFLSDEAGCGRDVRNAKLADCRKIRVIADSSSVGIFLGNGEKVLSARMYPPETGITLSVSGVEGTLYELESMSFDRPKEKFLAAIGEALIDFIPDKSGCSFDDVTAFAPKTGGAPANVCAAFTRLGGRSRLLTALGDDPFGHRIIHELSDVGVDTGCITLTDKANTALAFVSLDADGGRTFSFYRKPSADMLYDENDVKEEYLDNAFALHFCSVSLGDFPMKQAHKHAIGIMHKKGGIVSFDPNLRFNLWENKEDLRKAVREFIPLSDIVKLSEDELEFVTGNTDIALGCHNLFDQGVKLVLYTCGSKGAYAFTKNAKAYSPAHKVDTVDTTGAGDGFTGAFLWKLYNDGATTETLGMLSEATMLDCLAFANKFCAISVRKKGAIASYPTLEEMREVIIMRKEN